MQGYGRMHLESRRGRSAGPTFEEALYEHLRAAPWWLASTGAHAAGLLALSLLVGHGGAAQASIATVSIGESALTIPVEPDVRPEVVPTLPPDEPNVVPDTPLLPDDPRTLERNAGEVSQEDGDPQGDILLPAGPLFGTGQNTGVGVGGGARGGGIPTGGFSHRNLHLGGDGDTLTGTMAGLDWLKRHQDPAGPWDCDGFESRCTKNKCGGVGGPLFDPGVSGLATLAFLGYGETHRSARYGGVVRNALKYLKGIQDAEGCFGPRTSNHFVYNHAISAMAMAEAYGLTQSPLFKSSAQNGINFVLQCQNPYLAWRYGVRPQDNDTSVTGWMVMALKSGVMSGLDVDPAAFEGARAWLDKVTEPEYGRAGYTARGNGPARPQELMDRFPADKSESLTAVAVVTRIFSGEKTDSESVRRGADLCLRCLPAWDEAAGTIDYYYWYYGTLAMFQVGGDHWKRWNDAMKGSIVAHQHLDPKDDRYGSWDPVDPWAADGGRVYATAVNTLSLEVYYRYARLSLMK